MISAGILRSHWTTVCFLTFSMVSVLSSRPNEIDPAKTETSQTVNSQKGPSDAKSKTVVNMSFGEVRSTYPSDFGRFTFAESQEELPALLEKIGENVEAFFRDFLNTCSKEQIYLQRLRLGRVQASTGSEFNYLLLAPTDREKINIREDRSDGKGNPIDLANRQLISSAELERLSLFVVTAGFAGQCILLHPQHQPGSIFQYLGKQISGSHLCAIAFAQKPEVGDYVSAIYGYQGPTPVLVQGIVWVDPKNFQIVRMQTDLLEPDFKDGVKKQSTEVWFAETRFAEEGHSFWLPRRVLVTIERGADTFNNEHRYSDYRLFSVESSSKIVIPPVKK